MNINQASSQDWFWSSSTSTTLPTQQTTMPQEPPNRWEQWLNCINNPFSG